MASKDQYIHSSQFQGPRDGYYFTQGDFGVGYYRDEDTAALSGEDLLARAEATAGQHEPITLDSKSLRKLVLNLEKMYNRNLELRMKYADEPAKFMESELELDEAVRSLQVVASAPDVYEELVASGAVPILLALVSHENGDVASDCIELLNELTDAAETDVLINSLVENDIVSSLVQRLDFLDESVEEEANAVNNVLSIIENLIDMRPQVANEVVSKTGLMSWLLKRLQPKSIVDPNKLYACEITSILVASSDENRRAIAEKDSLDRILQAVAPYRNKDPETTEEEEYIENLFDVISACLMLKEGQQSFVESEGVELMLIIVRNKRIARGGALKALDFATTRCGIACDRLVDAAGLKTIFSAFMGKLKPKLKKEELKEDEERIVSILGNLFEMIPPECSRWGRVASKFAESDYEKIDRLMDLFLDYEARVEVADVNSEMEEDEALLSRMDSGLFTLQKCAGVAAALWGIKDPVICKRLLQVLHLKGKTLNSIRNVLKEQLDALGNDGDEEERQRQQQRLRSLLAGLGGHVEEGDGLQTQ